MPELMSISDILKTGPESFIRKSKPFSRFRKVIYSQCGEDGVISRIIKQIQNEVNFYVEFGAWDGTRLSNTANLRINQKWNGVLFEADKSKIPKNDINLFCETITSKNINEVFEKYNVPHKFGVLSIDIDGNDSYCWQALSNDYQPNIVIIESNPGLPNTIPIRIVENQCNKKNSYFGANLNLLYDLGISKGYSFVTTTDWNAFFVREEKFDLLNIEKLDKEMIMKIHTNSSRGCLKHRANMKDDLWIVNESFGG